MMELKVFFDGFELTQYILVKRVVPTTANRINNYSVHSHNSGRKHLYSKEEGLGITIEAYIRDDVMRARDELVKILYGANSQAELYLSDYPDRALICRFDGNIKPTSRFRNAGLSLTFLSDKPYWVARAPRKSVKANNQGIITANNVGTYKTLPKFIVKFKSECGYLAFVSPNGYIGLGNAKELDKIPVPPSEWAINDGNLGTLDGWSHIGNLENYVTDYNKMSSKGRAGTDPWGIIINKSTFTPPNPDVWQGHAYLKAFKEGVVHKEANNFNCRVDLHMQDLSGTVGNTCAVLIIIMDELSRPIITTSIYDATTDRNGLETSFKVRSSGADQHHSTIIHRGKLESLIGYIEMKKTGNKFEWLIHSDATSYQSGGGLLGVGDTVYISPQARYGYDYGNNRHSIASFTRGRAYRIGQVRTISSGKQYRIDYQGTPIYWMYENDLQHNKAPRTHYSQSADIRHTYINDSLAQIKPHKVAIWQAVWGNTSPYTRFGIHCCRVQRIYTTDYLEVENVFRPHDELVIDCQTGDILLNGVTFQGHRDPESRFFPLDYGESELQVIKSSWANLPEIEMTYEERYL